MKTWKFVALAILTGISVLLLVVAMVERRRDAVTRKVLAEKADRLDSFCDVERRVLEATARNLAIPTRQGGALVEFSNTFLSDPGQDKMILCAGIPAWQRVTRDNRAITCRQQQDVACMTAMTREMAEALGSLQAEHE